MRDSAKLDIFGVFACGGRDEVFATVHMVGGTPGLEGESAAPSLPRHLTVLYGTETGNAEEVAERIARMALRRRIDVHLQNLADYDKVRGTSSVGMLTPRCNSSTRRSSYLSYRPRETASFPRRRARSGSFSLSLIHT